MCDRGARRARGGGLPESRGLAIFSKKTKTRERHAGIGSAAGAIRAGALPSSSSSLAAARFPRGPTATAPRRPAEGRRCGPPSRNAWNSPSSTSRPLGTTSPSCTAGDRERRKAMFTRTHGPRSRPGTARPRGKRRASRSRPRDAPAARRLERRAARASSEVARVRCRARRQGRDAASVRAVRGRPRSAGAQSNTRARRR